MAAAAAELWEALKEAQAIGTTIGEAYEGGKAVLSGGKTRSGASFRRNINRSVIPRSGPPSKKIKTELGTPIHRNINHTQPNKAATTTMSKRGATSGDEVPVMPAGKVAKIHPDYYTVRLPYVHRFNAAFTDTDFNFTSGSPLFTIRMNSIYDPIKGTSAVAAGTNNANAQPQGRDIWAANFKFYRVLSADITVRFYSTYPMGLLSAPLHNSFAYGYELVDEDHTVANNTDMFMMTKRAKHNLLDACPITTSGNGTTHELQASAIRHGMIKHSYSPSQWTYHVEEQGGEERWTPILQNPAVDHDMAVRCMHMSGGSVPTGGGIGAVVWIEYVVQFREATDAHFKIQDTTPATYGGAGEQTTDGDGDV